MTEQQEQLAADPPQTQARVARRVTMISGIAVLFAAGVAAVVLAADALLLVFACILCAILLYKLSDIVARKLHMKRKLALALVVVLLGAIIGFMLLSRYLNDAVFGVVFGLIAGIMVFLAIDELLPAAKRYAKGHETVYGLVSGMGVLALSLVLFKW